MQKLQDAKEELERLYGVKVLPVQADISAGADNETAVQNVVKEAIDAPDPAERVDTVRCGIMDSGDMSLSDLCERSAAGWGRGSVCCL